MDDKVQELLECIREGAATASVAAADTARLAGKKAGQLVDAAKLNVQLFELSSDFNDILRQLGQVMYDTHTGAEASGETVSRLLAQADEVAQRREQVRERIAALRQSRICPHCGGTCGQEDKFCRGCGGAL